MLYSYNVPKTTHICYLDNPQEKLIIIDLQCWLLAVMDLTKSFSKKYGPMNAPALSYIGLHSKRWDLKLDNMVSHSTVLFVHVRIPPVSCQLLQSTIICDWHVLGRGDLPQQPRKITTNLLHVKPAWCPYHPTNEDFYV